MAILVQLLSVVFAVQLFFPGKVVTGHWLYVLQT